MRGDAPVPRVAYDRGALELMGPSKDHERIKSYIGRLIEAYALERGIDLSPYGAWTLKSATKEAGAEPDRYEPARRSSILPDLDIDLLRAFLDRPTALQAVRAFREALVTPGVPGRSRRRRG